MSYLIYIGMYVNLYDFYMNLYDFICYRIQ